MTKRFWFDLEIWVRKYWERDKDVDTDWVNVYNQNIFQTIDNKVAEYSVYGPVPIIQFITEYVL